MLVKKQERGSGYRKEKKNLRIDVQLKRAQEKAKDRQQEDESAKNTKKRQRGVRGIRRKQVNIGRTPSKKE